MIEEEDLDVFLKLIVVGNGGIGKSSLIHRYCHGNFANDYKKTIGVDFLEKQIICDNQDIRLQIWDTAGQEEFDSMTRSYYRGAHMCVLVFSATDRHSFESLLAWKHKVKNECENDIMMVMVMNKMDLSDKFEVDRYEAEHVARMLGMKMFRTSVKNNSNIDQVFNYLVDEYMSSGQIKNKQVFHKSIASIVLPVDKSLRGSLEKVHAVLDKDVAKPLSASIKLDSTLKTTKKRSKFRRHLVNRINRCV